jgi:2-iminobutanoate/2-iminopropanoate deaminase
VGAVPDRAGFGLPDIVSVRQWLTNIADTAAVRSEFIQPEPVSMVAIGPAVVWPTIRVEIEVVAARHDATPPRPIT